jgi:hypothetical protein
MLGIDYTRVEFKMLESFSRKKPLRSRQPPPFFQNPKQQTKMANLPKDPKVLLKWPLYTLRKNKL